jgi:ATPase subunit of ABC transporter with duplicated ATPase domains
VFKDESFSFGNRWTALIGANGTGKTTLLKLISGVLVPDSGTITVDGGGGGNSGGFFGGNIAVCAQDRESPPDCFFDPDIVNDRAFFSLLSHLGIGDDWVGRWDTLSGGEKKRCVIADILIRKPDVLILDEPANHIDEATMKLLANALLTFEGTGIIVSHNMAFLNGLATATVMLVAGLSDNGSCVFSFSAPPVLAVAEFEKEQEGRRERKQLLTIEAKKIERAQKDAVRDALQDKNKRMSKKHIDLHDSDTRGKINRARLTGRDRAGGKKAAMLETAFSKKEAELQDMSAIGLRKTGVGLNGQKSSRPVLFYRESGKIKISDTYTLSHPALEVKNDSRIVITGNNGSGKTSLLKHIADSQKGPAYWYLPQELSEQSRRAVMQNVNALKEKEKGALLSLVYRLGSEPQAILATRHPSPGETRKLLFAEAMLRGVSLILLDEPANHIDAVSADALASAIREFEGAVILVTHDHIFAEKTGNVFWRIERHNNEGQIIIEQGETR